MYITILYTKMSINCVDKNQKFVNITVFFSTNPRFGWGTAFNNITYLVLINVCFAN